MSTPIIEVRNLSKEFKVKINSGKILKDMFKPETKKVQAVHKVNFKINEGESVAFLGPNGAGKTTTIKMLTGLIFPTKGSVRVLGYTPFERDRDFLQQIGLVMGNKAGLNWDLSPKQNFWLLKQIYKIDEKQFEHRVNELIEMLDVKDVYEVQVRRMSLGQRMKMELIGAILHNPKILFLDEPTIGLDIISKQKVRDFLIQIQKEFNTTLLLTSHDMDDVERVCKRVMIINRGDLVLDTNLNRLMQNYRKERYVKFIFKQKTNFLEETHEIIERGSSYIVLKTTQKGLPEIIKHMTTSYQIHDIDIISIPLEEIIADNF